MASSISLDVSDVRKHFATAHDRVEVLRGISFRLAGGDSLAITGPSGSGKSTLLRCCNRLEEPTRGHILVDGVDIMGRGVNVNALRRQIGMVFQSFNLYPHMTALGNVTLALRKVLGMSKSEANRLGQSTLGRVGLEDKRDSYPNQLSGGQLQRLMAATALA